MRAIEAVLGAIACIVVFLIVYFIWNVFWRSFFLANDLLGLPVAIMLTVVAYHAIWGRKTSDKNSD
jgi:hypothetical protein